MAGVAVFVDSRGGNTRRVADAIAEELGIVVGDIAAPLPGDARLLFLGSGTYGSAPGAMMMKFIAAGSFAGRNVALFGTSGGDDGSVKMIAVMAEALEKKGATVIGSWHSRGQFLLLNWGRPNEEDLAGARKFAREMAASR